MPEDFLDVLRGREAELSALFQGGLYDFERRPRPVAGACKHLLEELGQMALVPHAELLIVNDGPTRLKTEV